MVESGGALELTLCIHSPLISDTLSARLTTPLCTSYERGECVLWMTLPRDAIVGPVSFLSLQAIEKAVASAVAEARAREEELQTLPGRGCRSGVFQLSGYN
jgi:hypothetical protein